MPAVAIVFLAAVSAVTVWAFRSLRTVRSGVRGTWTELEAAVADRTALVTKLVDAVTPKLSEQASVQLTKAHERMGTVVGPRSVDSADRSLRTIIDPILETLPSELGLDTLKSQIKAANGMIDEAATRYNEQVEKYEATRQSGVFKMVASTMGFEKEYKFRVDLQPAFASALDPVLV
jgi:hypothetical protein